MELVLTDDVVQVLGNWAMRDGEPDARQIGIARERPGALDGQKGIDTGRFAVAR